MSTQTFICSSCNNVLSIVSKESGKYGKRCKECVKKAKLSNNKKPRERDIEETNYESEDWQGGKYAGSVFERKTDNIICAIGGKQKNFSIKKFINI